MVHVHMNAQISRGGAVGWIAPNQQWFAVHTLPHKENSAELHLKNQSFITFLPRIRKTMRHARRFYSKLVPLFPRYLFVALDPERDQWCSINGTYGVARLVMQHNRPLPVPPGVVESLLVLADDNGCVHLERSKDLHPGQKVLIETGPLASHIAVIEHLDGKGRVALLLELMGQKARVYARADALRPVI